MHENVLQTQTIVFTQCVNKQGKIWAFVIMKPSKQVNK